MVVLVSGPTRNRLAYDLPTHYADEGLFASFNLSVVSCQLDLPSRFWFWFSSSIINFKYLLAGQQLTRNVSNDYNYVYSILSLSYL
jgi:hypothetical protein